MHLSAIRGHSVLVTLAIATASPLSAQVTGSFDIGSGTMRVGQETPSGIFRLAPTLELRTLALLLSADGDFAGHTEGGWQTTGKLRSVVRQRVGQLLELSLGAEGGWSHTRWGRSAGGWLGEGRATLRNGRQGFTLALGSGHSFVPGGTQPLSRLEAGGWSKFGRLDVGLWLKRTGLTAPSDESSGNPRDTLQVGAGQRTLQDHYTDAEATLGWTHGSLALEAGAGRRFGKAVRFTSWYVRGLLQLTSRVGLVATSGQFPVDVVSGLPSGSFTTLSMRINLRNDSPRTRPSVSTPISRSGFFEARRDDQNRTRISVLVPDAQAVEMMGSFSDWEPVLLVPDGSGQWVLRMYLRPGLHEVNIRINGGPWMVPAGLPSVDDDLGGRVGVFLVE